MPKKLIHVLIFGLGGAAVGALYYKLFACTGGSCPISASLPRTMVYTAIIGVLLSVVFSPGKKKTAVDNRPEDKTE